MPRLGEPRRGFGHDALPRPLRSACGQRIGRSCVLLANPNKVEHIAVINRRLGLMTPAILSPELLWIEEPL